VVDDRLGNDRCADRRLDWSVGEDSSSGSQPEAGPELDRFEPLALGVLLAVNATTLVVWFFGAPDPRFALAALWLVPIGAFVWIDLRWSLRRYLFATTAVGVAIVAIWLSDYPRFSPPITGGDPFGTTAARTAAMEPYASPRGIAVWTPTGGADQCWKVVPCTPYPTDSLKLRGTSVGNGFRQDSGSPLGAD
jgi:hypothetical protein